MPNMQLLEDFTGVDNLAARVEVLERKAANAPDPNCLSMVVFSGELDRLLSAFFIATGAAASGMKVEMFFTFWAMPALKRLGPQPGGKSLLERMFGWMLPGGFRGLRLSRMNMGGVGPHLIARMMRKQGAPDLPCLLARAKELGVRISICETVMSLMGIRPEEVIDYPGLSYCGVVSFLDRASRSNTTLFI